MFQRNVVEKIETHILCTVPFFLESRADYKAMWKNIVELGSQQRQRTTWRVRIAYWITKPHTHTHTHSEYLILTAFHCNNSCTNEPQCYVLVHCLSRCNCHESSLPISREQFLLIVGVTFSNLGLEETLRVPVLSGVLA